MRCTGSRRMRRSIQASYCFDCSTVSSASRNARSPRFTPSNSDRRTSAEATGSGTPAFSSRNAASRAACLTLAALVCNLLAGCTGCLGSKLLGPLGGSESLGELREISAQHGFHVVRRQADAVIRDSALRKIVRADLRRTVASPDLRLPQRAFFGRPFLHLAFEKARTQNPHRLLLVLELALLVLARYDEA